MGLFDKFKKNSDDETPKTPATGDDQKQAKADADTNAQDFEQPDFNPAVMQLTNDDLLISWRQHQNEQTDETLSAFLDELIERAKLILVVFGAKDLPTDNAGYPQIPEGTELQFPLLQTQDDNSFQPVFTDWQAVNELFDQWNESGNHDAVMNSQVIPVDFATLAAMIADNQDVTGAVINPFSDNISLDRDSLADLKRQMDERHQATNAASGDDQEQVTFQISMPEHVPAELVASLQDKLATDSRVHRAWLRTMTYQDQSNLFLIVDLTEPEESKQDELFDALRAIGAEFLAGPDAEQLIVGPYAPEMADALDGTETIYPN